MSSPIQKVKLSFSAKILIPVFALLVLLPGLMLFVVHRSSIQQLEREARHQLRTADAVFQNSLELRSRQILARYKHIVDEASFAAVTLTKDVKTMTRELATRLEKLEGDADLLLFIAENGTTFAAAQRDPNHRLIDFEKAISPITSKALAGQPTSAVVPVQSSVFNTVAIPLLDPQHIARLQPRRG